MIQEYAPGVPFEVCLFCSGCDAWQLTHPYVWDPYEIEELCREHSKECTGLAILARSKESADA